MILTQAVDFKQESEVLYRALAGLSEDEFSTLTRFKGWCFNDVLVHLHFWNRAADLSASDEVGFAALMQQVMACFQTGNGLRSLENNAVQERGIALREAWINQARDMGDRWQGMDPKRRLPWAGPSMSARSSMTARQMETWAHGFEVFDALGLVRVEQDRIRNIVVLGVNTFGWSHQVNGLDLPERMPLLSLTAPSGVLWTFGDQGAGEGAGKISGTATDFAAVVTQTRALADTSLVMRGDIARVWMANAQCFAGPPETPPRTGSRKRETSRGKS